MNESGFTQDSKVLGKRRLGYGFVANLQESRTVPRTILAHNVRIDCDAHGIRKRMQNSFNRNFLYSGMEQGAHQCIRLYFSPL
jgi:hypothetical protein